MMMMIVLRSTWPVWRSKTLYLFDNNWSIKNDWCWSVPRGQSSKQRHKWWWWRREQGPPEWIDGKPENSIRAMIRYQLRVQAQSFCEKGHRGRKNQEQTVRRGRWVRCEKRQRSHMRIWFYMDGTSGTWKIIFGHNGNHLLPCTSPTILHSLAGSGRQREEKTRVRIASSPCLRLRTCGLDGACINCVATSKKKKGHRHSIGFMRLKERKRWKKQLKIDYPGYEIHILAIANWHTRVLPWNTTL